MNRLTQLPLARFFVLLAVPTAVLFLLGVALLTLPTATAASGSYRPQVITTTTPTMTTTVTVTTTATMSVTVTPTTTVTLTPSVTLTSTFVVSAAVYLPAVVIPLPSPTSTPSPTPSPTAVGCLPNPPLGPGNSTVDAAVFAQINQQRNNNGLVSYSDNIQLMQAARRHAHDMADNDVFSHTGSDGSTVAQRISQACYKAQFTNEIIGWGFPTVDDMMTWWMNSSTHRGAILHANLQDIGVAYVRQTGTAFTHYWAVVFARPTTAASLDTLFYICTETIAEAGRGMSVQWMQERPCGE